MEMIKVSIFMFFLVSFIFGQQSSIEGGWKNIEVFQTSRAEAESILGKPSPNVDKIHTIYPTSEAHVVIVYSYPPCSNTLSHRGSFKLQKDTVIDYKVHLKKSFPLSDLKWKKEDYGRIEEPHILGMFNYYNPKEGVWFTTEMDNGIEMVRSFWFFGTDEQKKHFRCKENEKVVSIESGWKDIKVFQTKRAEVEKIFGKPTSPDGGHMIYKIPEGNLVVIYAENPCSKATFGRGYYLVEKDVVIQYQVNLRDPILLSDLKWKKEVYQRAEEPHLLQAFRYGNSTSGVSFDTRIGNDNVEKVLGFSYFPNKELNERFRCGKNRTGKSLGFSSIYRCVS